MSRLLNKHISILKTDIQDLLNKINNEESKYKEDKLNEFKELKEKKTQELKNSLIKLNTVLKEEKEIEFAKINRTMDNLNYQRVKKNPERNNIMLDIKETRIKAKDNYDKLIEIEKQYLLIDPEKLPGFLFFHKSIINKYGLCPFILCDTTEPERIQESLYNSRKNWLNETVDNGKTYFDLYDIIVNKTEINQLKINEQNLNIYFENVLNDVLTESQKKKYNESIEYLIQYVNTTIKTKKTKEIFKILINNISTLILETKLNIDLFLSIKYSCHIPINTLQKEDVELPIDIQTYTFIYESFNEKVNNYKDIKESIVSNERFVRNTTKNLQSELYEYINNKPTTIVKVKQEGKYHNKKWGELTTDEKNDRFNSFSQNFVETFLIASNLLDKKKKNDTINILYNLLLQSYNEANLPKKSKNTKKNRKVEPEQLPEQLPEQNIVKLKSKDIKWNIKSGIITKISSLQWDDTLKKLFIQPDTKINLPVDNIVNDVNNNLKIKKISSIKTILNKKNEEIINEEIIKYILLKLNCKKDTLDKLDTNDLKTSFIEILKLKLKLKRITNNDKTLIYKKFDEIYSVIINNQNF